MNVSKKYQEKLITIPEAVSKVKSNQKVVTAMAASEPQGLLHELENRSDELENVNIVSCLMMGDYNFLEPKMKGTFLNETWFYGPADRKNHKHGNVTYIPNNLHEAGMKKLENDDLNIFWGTATPMDENLPWTLGDTQVHISQVDHLVENTTPLIEVPPIEPGEEEKQIGEHVAKMIEDGSTLQLGIGGIPNAIAHSLKNKKDLGVHTEMFTDGMVDLFKEGVITNQKKTLWKGKMVGTFAMGTKKLYDFIDTNLAVEFQQGSVTNDPCIIGQNHKMVSVNTALQVDLTGQVCSEAIGNKHYSGTGGQVDTHRGAQRSEGGKGIIALRSTAKGGEVSTILAQLPQGSKITLGRNDIDYVVTEYGVAHLKGKSIRDRVDAMISIAHPDFRDEIRERANELKIW